MIGRAKQRQIFFTRCLRATAIAGSTQRPTYRTDYAARANLASVAVGE